MLRRASLALLLFAFVALATGPAQPAPATPAVHRCCLPNGLTVLVQERHTAPVVTTMLWYKVGSRDELPGATGIAHFLEHLMFKGTRRLRKGDIDRITYQNGGANNAFTYTDYTAYQFSFPRDRWQVALEIEADRMRHTVFDPREFEAERRVVMEERRLQEDDPESRLYEQVNALTFVSHPYRNPVIGWMEDIRRLRIQQVKEFYDRFYVPANAILVITGDVKPAEAFRAARRAFAKLPRLPAPQRRAVVEPRQPAMRRLRLEIPANVPRVIALFHAPRRADPQFYAAEVLAAVLGEGKRSRLYQRLVERESLAADADAFYPAARDPGIFGVDFNLKAGADPDAAEAALWDELGRLTREPVSDRELQRAKNQLLADFVREQETASGLATLVGEAATIGGLRLLQNYAAAVGRVTAEEVRAAAARTLIRTGANVGVLVPQVHPTASTLGGKKAVWPAPAGRRVASAADGAPLLREQLTPTHRPRPAGGPAPRFAPLPVTVERLPNGLKLMLLENHALPSVTLAAQVRVGSREEPAAQAGLANFVARMLAEGASERTEAEISEALEFAGAQFSATAGRATTTITLKTLTSALPDLLPLYTDLLRRPAFPEDRLELERGRILTDIRAADEDPGTVAHQAFFALVYGSHPNGRPILGSEATVRGLRREDLARFHTEYFRPQHTTLVAVGDFQTQALLARLRALFGDWESREPSSSPPVPPPPRWQGVRTRRIERETVQTQIALGHLGIRRQDPDYFPLLVMDTILGEGVAGGFTARIPQQIRDVQGLAYVVGASITSSAGLEPGVFLAMMGTAPRNEQRAIAALLKEIRRIRQELVSETELREAVNYLVSSYVFEFQTNDQLASYLLGVDLYNLGINYRQRYPRLVRAVTRAEVLRAARAHLDPVNYALVVVGPPRPLKP
ncbi:MAG: insulinase family protein [Armatimonadetes bacterium]|nr:insulinase family protein [Armatimonadota bacterium]